MIIEIEGAILDIQGAWHRAHVAATADVGWSSLDAPTFWRLTRKDGLHANLLPGAKPMKTKAYVDRFAERLEERAIIDLALPGDRVAETLGVFAATGAIVAVTLGANVEPRRSLVQRTGLNPPIARIEGLANDPRRRPGELRILSENHPRTLVAAASDGLVRAAQSAGLFTVGISSGACAPARLHQAGADLVYPDLRHLTEALADGAAELVRRGWPPPAYL